MPNLPLLRPEIRKNDRIYYRREKTTTADQESLPFWFVLRIHTGDPLPSIRKSLWLLHWANAHILDHKHLFAPPSLQPQHTSIGYTADIGAQFNNILTLPPTDVMMSPSLLK